MIEELSTLLQGKQTTIKNCNYFSAEAYIRPFLERMEALHAQINCLAKAPEQLSITNGQPDFVYNKVHIQAVLPPEFYEHDHWRAVMGMCYGLDCKVPIAKFYIADINPSGLITSFSPEALKVQKIESDTSLDYSVIQPLFTVPNINGNMLDQLKNVFLSREELQEKLGSWIDYAIEGSFTNEGGKIKIPTSMPIDVYKAITKNKDSEFYVPSTEQVSLYQIYMAFLDIICKDDKDIINRFEKTILINRLLQLQ